MPQQNVTMNFPAEFIERLDKWAKARRLKRNAAVMLLLEIVQQNRLVQPEEATNGTRVTR